MLRKGCYTSADVPIQAADAGTWTHLASTSVVQLAGGPT
jgi:hypothetical protein